MYNKEGAKLFQDNETIPSDYVDCPTKVDTQKAVLEQKPVTKKVKKKNDNS